MSPDLVMPAFNFMVIKGLEKYQQYAFARECAIRHLYYILEGLSPLDEKKKLDDLVANSEQEELSSDDVLHFVVSAQELQEKRAFSARQNNTKKDDIIAPQRIKFYNERARLLNDENAATEFINQFAADKRVLIEEHIDALYEQVKNLLIRISFGERILMSIPLVFSEGKRLFTIVVDIQATIASRQYFAEEYKRQMVLHTFDRYWKRFVSHLLSKLDVNEVNKLPDDFNLMNEKIKEAVLRRLLFAEMPIRKISTIERAKRQEQNKKRWEPTPINFKRRTIILNFDNNQLCPCGSGKKFSECHGRDIRHNRLRNNRILIQMVTVSLLSKGRRRHFHRDCVHQVMDYWY